MNVYKLTNKAKVLPIGNFDDIPDQEDISVDVMLKLTTNVMIGLYQNTKKEEFTKEEIQYQVEKVVDFIRKARFDFSLAKMILEGKILACEEKEDLVFGLPKTEKGEN